MHYTRLRLPHALRIVLALFCLNTLFWLPFIFRRQRDFTWFPWPTEAMPRGIYDSLIFFIARRPTADLFHISIDLIALWALTLFFSRGKRPKLVLLLGGSLLYTLTCLYQIYHELIIALRARLPSFHDDLQQLNSLGHYLSDTLHIKQSLLPLLVLIGFAALWLIVFKLWSPLFRSKSVSKAGSIVMVLFLLFACFHQFKLPAEATSNVLRSATRMAWDNSQRASSTVSSLVPEVHFLQPLFKQEAPTKLPSVYFLVLESYGRVLLDDPQLNDGYQLMLKNFSEHLQQLGWTMRSQFSQAPVFGGGSWMSLATLHEGKRIDNQEQFEQIKTSINQQNLLVTTLNDWGYSNLGLMPGNRHSIDVDGKRSQLYAYENMIEGRDIPYRGPAGVYAWIPDQFSLEWTAAQYLTPAAKQQAQHFFFMSTNSHAPWQGVPPIVENWQQLDQTPSKELTPQFTSIWDHVRNVLSLSRWLDKQAYLDAVAYEFAALQAFIGKHVPADALVVIIGDHQPYFAIKHRSEAPLHILSQDSSYLNWLEQEGFRELESWTQARLRWRHEDIAPLILASILQLNKSPIHPQMLAPIASQKSEPAM